LTAVAQPAPPESPRGCVVFSSCTPRTHRTCVMRGSALACCTTT
jgi:hypothetical protein